MAQEIGVTIPTDPPQIEAPHGPDTLTLTGVASPAALDLAFTPSPLGTNLVLLIDATDTLSAGISNAGGKFRRIKVTAANPTSPVNILTDWQNKFGTLVAGTKVFVRVAAVNTHTLIKSPEVITSDIIA
jgi:hypothetical protein